MTLNFSMNREMLKRCIRQLLVTVVTMSPHGQRPPMVTGVPRTSCVIIMSPELDRDNKLIQIGSHSSMLRYFCVFFARRAA